MKCKQCKKYPVFQVTKYADDYAVELCEQCKDIYEFELLMRKKYGLQLNIELIEETDSGSLEGGEPLDASEL